MGDKAKQMLNKKENMSLENNEVLAHFFYRKLFDSIKENEFIHCFETKLSECYDELPCDLISQNSKTIMNKSAVSYNGIETAHVISTESDFLKISLFCYNENEVSVLSLLDSMIQQQQEEDEKQQSTLRR